MTISIQKTDYTTPLRAQTVIRTAPLRQMPYDCVCFKGSKTNIESAKLASDCAILAGKSYPDKFYRPLPENYKDVSKNFSEHRASLRLNGVVAKVFLNKQDKRCVVAYAGTYNLPEFVKNARSALTGRARANFSMAENLFQSVKKKYPGKEIIVVGHSAGGGLAQYVAAKNDIAALTYAPAGIGRFLKELDIPQKSYPKIINYIASKDPVTEPFFENIGRVFRLPIKLTHSLYKFVGEEAYKNCTELTKAEFSKISPSEMALSHLQIMLKRLTSGASKFLKK